MKIWTQALPYFSAAELACHHCGLLNMDMRMAAALPALRHEWGAPLDPSSVCRCPVHNAQVGGNVRSLHLTEMSEPEKAVIASSSREVRYGTMAADILWQDWSLDDQIQFANLAWSMGWSVGLSLEFVHCDRRIDVGLAQHVFEYAGWDGFSKSEVGGD